MQSSSYHLCSLLRSGSLLSPLPLPAILQSQCVHFSSFLPTFRFCSHPSLHTKANIVFSSTFSATIRARTALLFSKTQLLLRDRSDPQPSSKAISTTTTCHPPPSHTMHKPQTATKPNTRRTHIHSLIPTQLSPLQIHKSPPDLVEDHCFSLGPY